MTRPVPQLKTLRKLSKYQNTIGVVDKCSLEQLSAFWDSADESKHARERGLNAHLAFLEKFYMKAAVRDNPCCRETLEEWVIVEIGTNLTA